MLLLFLIHIASLAIRQVVWMLIKSTTLQHWPRPDEVVLAMSGSGHVSVVYLFVQLAACCPLVVFIVIFILASARPR